MIRSGKRPMMLILAALLLLGSRSPALAVNPAPVQLFYVPFPEDQVLQGLQAISGNSTPTNPVTTYISIVALAPGTVIYYDQWENGYDADIANPANLYSGGNPGGTQVWGDGNAANGAPPGVPTDLINPGTPIILSNDVTTTNLSAIDFDGRDKIATTKNIAVSRTSWAAGSGTLLAGSIEVFDTNSWGTNYLAPVGANIPDATDHQMFEYTSLAIMAGEGGATVQIDKDANGVFETTQVLSEGQSYFVNGGVNVGGRVVSDKPVQVDILTGDIGSNYESRDSALLPTTLWSTKAYTPVSTPATAQGVAGAATTVWLYNPGTASITVQYTTRNGSGALTTTSLTVPGGTAGGYLPQILPDGYGARFTSSSSFYAFSTTNSTDTSTGGNQAWDWGFTLVPEDSLTPQVLIGLGIGRDPTSGTNPTENGNPVWVTPVGNLDTAVTVYVDFDADPNTGALIDPNNNKYDVAYSLKEIERVKIYDTGDRNQTGTLIYTLAAGVKLAAAWGQDPATASAASPGLDVGTGVPPLPLFAAGKNGTLAVDNDGDGFVSPGDQLLYTISISNISRAPVPDLVLLDTIPNDTTYVPITTFFKNASNVTNPISDDVSGTPFPLDGTGIVLDQVTALRVGGSYEVTFRVTVDSLANLTPGTTGILNTGLASAVGTDVAISDLTPLAGKIGDFVWNDLDADGVQDGGAEVGLAGVTVNLVRDVNGDGLLDGGDVVVDTEVTNASGGYLFTGVVAGKYIVDVVGGVPAGWVLTTGNEPAAVTLAGGQILLTVDFGYRNPCIPADCNDNNPCTDDTCGPTGCVHTPHVGVCRAAAGPCDVAESCSGTTCPADGFASSATVCRASAGACDLAENCTGSGASCPADAKSTAVCRASAGVCDVAESCDGVGNACPADAFQASTVVCRAAAGVCDVAENCTGSGASCPADAKSTAVCRASAGVCDVAESCDGAGNDCPADGFQPSSVVCRASGGVCDLAENCTGSGASCPADAKSTAVCRAAAGVCDLVESCDGVGNTCPADVKSTAVCRAAAGVCDVAESCTGSSNTCPADAFQSASVVCRPSAGVCDPAESCTGSSANCPADGKSTAVCRASAGACDLTEVCDGVGDDCPADAKSTFVCRAAAGVCDVAEVCDGVTDDCPGDAKSTAVCRAAAGVCDVAESCDGVGNACPADAFQPASVVCRASAGVCDLTETCTGGGANCPADAKSTAVCRVAAGVCDMAESCTGSSNTCPADAFQPASVVCRTAAGVCDLSENCPGNAPDCPADAKSTAVCRATAGVCDVAESCDGVDDACPADAFQSPTVVCRAAAGVCDVAETCTGASAACPANAFESSSTVCRAAAGVCDVAERCTGASASCPANGFESSSTVCRASAGDCDIVETCTGNGAACPADDFLGASHVCRASAGACDEQEKCTGSGPACPPDAKSTDVCRTATGACDVAESCDGVNDDCPADAFAPSTQECRAVNGVCDVAEQCTGTGASCPPDAFAPSTATCRAAAGDCDVAENCTGTGRNCPADHFAPSSQGCRPANGACDVADTCPGNGPTCGADEVAATTVVCRAAVGQCDVAERCDGVGTTCPADALAPSGTSCDDGDPCTTGDVCSAGGSCAGPPVDCDDHESCTDDTCNPNGNAFLCVHTQNPGNPGCQLPVQCGNGVVDAGETCDPPDPTLDPVTLQPLCRIDCTRCGDGVLQVSSGESCDDGNTVSGCNKKKPLDSCQTNCTGPICNDPGQVKLAAPFDLFKFHGMLISNASVDFIGNHLVTELRDVNDVVLYRVSLPANSLVQIVPKVALYKNLAAKTQGGPMKVKVKSGPGYYKIYVMAYGQLDAAVEDMQTHVFSGALEWTVHGLWTPDPAGWRFGSKGVLLPVR